MGNENNFNIDTGGVTNPTYNFSSISYLTDAYLYDRHTVDTIEESLDSIDRCIERNRILKLQGND